MSRLYISLTWHIYDFHHVGGTLTKESHWLVLFVILFSSNMADWPSKALFSESQVGLGGLPVFRFFSVLLLKPVFSV